MSVTSIVANGDYLLGTLGFLSLAYADPEIEFMGSFCLCIGPLVLVTVLVALAAAKAGTNILLASGTTCLITGVFWFFDGLGSTRYAPTVGVPAIIAFGGLVALAINYLRGRLRLHD
jgi:hypothetical protein